MAYLDETGLAYYDGKLKDYLASPGSNIVHRSGDETLGGVKTFRNSKPGFLTGETVTDLVIRNSEVNQGTPLGSGRSYTRVVLADAEGDTEETQAGRLGILEVQTPKENDYAGALLKLRCYNYRTSSDEEMAAASLVAGFDPDGTPYAAATETSESRDSGTDIVTRNWIPKDTRIVHTTGDESVAGNKTFSGIIYANGGVRQTDNTATLVLRGGPTNSTSSSIVLNGGESSTYAGDFRILARINNSNSCLLQGTPSGTLSWGGQPIQTSSDERIKTPLSEVPDAVLDAWEEVNWGQFQYLDAIAEKGESARLHLGLIAQHVMSVFKKRGLDACAYGILCHEERPAVDEEETVVDAEAYVDAEGVEHSAAVHVETRHEDAVDLWMVRYAEAQAMEACCARRENARLKKRIAGLEERLAALELKIS